jgi:hypothetical protein
MDALRSSDEPVGILRALHLRTPPKNAVTGPDYPNASELCDNRTCRKLVVEHPAMHTAPPHFPHVDTYVWEEY